MKFSKKLLAIIMAVLMLASVIPASVMATSAQIWDHNKLTSCSGGKDSDDPNPIIIVPGIMQSQTYVLANDEYKGNTYEGEYKGETVNYIMTSEKTSANDNKGFPVVEGMDMSFMFDTNAVVEELKASIPTLLKAMATSDKETIYNLVVSILDSACKDHYFNTDGTPINERSVDEYWYSLAEAEKIPDRAYKFAKGYRTDENGNTKPTENYKVESDFINRQVDMSSYYNKYGKDHIYYYAYPSFGNTFESASKLPEFIQMVKEQTGHDKVSLCFISLGGTLANVFLSEYCDPSNPENQETIDSIDRIILAACALDGSYLLSDLMSANTTLEETEIIYNDLIPNIVSLVGDEYMSLAYLGNSIARILPEKLFSEFLNEALTRAVNDCLANMIRNCPSMWSLVPSGEYINLRNKYIGDNAHAGLREITDRYFEIQQNAAKTIKQRNAEGIDIFVICGYDLELPALVGHYAESSDNIIQASSTSAGGTFAKAGEQLTEKQLAGVDAKYISPDKNANISTCAIPDKTFLIKGQSHLTLQSAINDTIELCIQIAVDHNLKNATTESAGYAQFLEYRDLSTVEKLIAIYTKADLNSLSSEKRAAVDEAYEKGVQLLANRKWNADEKDEVEKEMYKAFEKAGLLSSKQESSFVKYSLLPFLLKITKAISRFFELIFKGNDFWIF